MVEIRYKFNNKTKNIFDSIKAKLVTIATLLYINGSRVVFTQVMPALAKAKKGGKKPSGGSSGGGGGTAGGGTYTPSAPGVDSGGNVHLNGNGKNLFDNAGTFIKNATPVIGIIIAIVGLGSIIWAVWYAGKAGRDISRADSTGWGRAGYAIIGAIVTGVVLVGGGIAMSLGITGGQSIFNAK